MKKEPTTYVDEFGIATSREFIACLIWHEMTAEQRLEIMRIVKRPKKLHTWYNRCVRYVERNMVEYEVNGNVLTGKLSIKNTEE